jgi:glycosyltransferase involved in cell wall biosynthesis
VALRKANFVLAQNHESAAILRRYARNVSTYPNASVDPEVSEVRHCDGEPRTALVAGRLVAWKGTSLAIRAISQRSDWTLEIVGAGPDKGRLCRLATDLGVGERVRFVPWLPQHALWHRMAASAVVIVPSMREAASLVAAEAASLGVPVIALDRGGPRALAQMSPALIHLVPAGTPTAAVAGIVDALASVGRTERTPADAFSINQTANCLRSAYCTTIGSDGLSPAGGDNPENGPDRLARTLP